jgi:restriction system protein
MPDQHLNPPLPPRPFIGRDAELERLEREVYRREPRYPDMPIVITGEPGIGKTAFAAEFVARHSRRERSIWVQCRDWEMSVLPFRSILSDRDIEVREALVVLDGADEIPHEQFTELFRTVVNFKLVRSLLITSRKELELRGEREIRLERLAEKDSESLIKESRAISGLDESSLSKVVSAVNGHPLAISLIAEMAKTMDKEHLKRVLAGHLYDLDDAKPADREGLISIAKPVIVSANEAMVEALKKHPKDIFRLSPRKYEELIAELLDDMGYEVSLTKATRDGGKDILASMKTECGDFLCLVEAKRYRQERKIGVSLVRTLYGTLCDYQATSGMLVTTSTYSPDAQAFQKNHQYQLSLRDYTDVAGWIQQYGAVKKH